jgi:hypothetical protein
VAGDRVFPATIAVDDPGVNDEADFQFGHMKVPNDNGDNVNTNTVSASLSKTITTNFGISIAGTYVNQNSPEGTAKGFDNVEIGAKYMLYKSAPHEFMLSVGVDAELGGTGSKAVSNSFSTISPALFFGKGFGDLPDSLDMLKPFAITGKFGPTYPTDSMASKTFDWGFTLQYSLPYLQSNVKDIGLRGAFAHMIPIVEFPMSTCTSGDCPTRTTGTINPGVLWQYRYAQIGVEGQIPLNRASGSGTGVLIQMHFYLDDMFPRSIGKPIF